jgi:hypothetical protein
LKEGTMGRTKRSGVALLIAVGALGLTPQVAVSCVSLGGNFCDDRGGGASDGPPPVISIGNVSGQEGTGPDQSTPFTFRVVRAGSTSAAASAKYKTVEGEATSPEDFAAKSGTVRFRAGQSVKKITINVVADSTDECVFVGEGEPPPMDCEEKFSVKLSSPNGATIGDAKGIGTIHDDDAGGPV